jgi:UDP-glucuronate decarboxylase
LIDQTILEDIERIKSDLGKVNLKDKKVLVTGGAGFIGSWLCDILISLDAEVACLDDLSTGRIDFIDHLLDKSEFHFFNDNVCTFKSDDKYDMVFHLASHPSPEEYQRNPIETLRTSSEGTYNIAELARKLDATILFTSTSEIYGNAEIIPTPETYWGKVNPVGPRSCYFEGKRFAESLFMAYHRQYGLDVKIARTFNSYGPRLREDGLYGRVVPRFMIQALTNQPITIYGDGTQTRSFCYITDTISGLILLASSKNSKGEIINIGNLHEVTILQLAMTIKELTKSTSHLAFGQLPQDDPIRRCPDTSKIEKLLGWKPKITLEEGLERTIIWFTRKGGGS